MRASQRSGEALVLDLDQQSPPLVWRRGILGLSFDFLVCHALLDRPSPEN
jgi:hypothetical protein